ncbi:MAG: DNA translocase FtsK 4TM domain-containing protein, partial [Candidatus Eiseniibacteriota bacterium]
MASISDHRQRQILALLLAAFAVLSAASLLSWRAPLTGLAPWSSRNACGPVGAGLAFACVWACGRMASFGIPIVAGAWSWNRLRQKPGWPLAVSSVLGGLLVFEICTLLALGGVDRWAWAGAWGLAAAMALRSALGGIGSWIVAGALFGVTALAASEFGFHWITHLAHHAVMTPANGIAGLIRTWREERDKALSKPRIRHSRPQSKAQEDKAQRPRIATARAAGGGPGGAVSVETEDDGQFRLPLPGLR